METFDQSLVLFGLVCVCECARAVCRLSETEAGDEVSSLARKRRHDDDAPLKLDCDDAIDVDAFSAAPSAAPPAPAPFPLPAALVAHPLPSLYVAYTLKSYMCKR
ncbi:hypothetical protein EVAR_48945_1 [Eumeta japonica]|uniref:Secreted protein n=1 Tax=Eumeta variegata TaxID=151549 RepID=A0A4C1Y4U3_EUMVA|nr:hypothetical protein EVAR_48945_1 [Eumeta japonica]